MLENSKPNQCKRLIRYMKKHGGITQSDAYEKLGIWRLASRISELRKKGYIFKGEMITVRNRFGETCRVKQYTLEMDGDDLDG